MPPVNVGAKACGVTAANGLMVHGFATLVSAVFPQEYKALQRDVDQLRLQLLELKETTAYVALRRQQNKHVLKAPVKQRQQYIQKSTSKTPSSVAAQLQLDVQKTPKSVQEQVQTLKQTRRRDAPHFKDNQGTAAKQLLVPFLEPTASTGQSGAASKLRSHPLDYSSSLLSHPVDLDGVSDDEGDEDQQEESASASRRRIFPVQINGSVDGDRAKENEKDVGAVEQQDVLFTKSQANLGSCPSGSLAYRTLAAKANLLMSLSVSAEQLAKNAATAFKSLTSSPEAPPLPPAVLASPPTACIKPDSVSTQTNASAISPQAEFIVTPTASIGHLTASSRLSTAATEASQVPTAAPQSPSSSSQVSTERPQVSGDTPAAAPVSESPQVFSKSSTASINSNSDSAESTPTCTEHIPVPTKLTEGLALNARLECVRLPYRFLMFVGS